MSRRVGRWRVSSGFIVFFTMLDRDSGLDRDVVRDTRTIAAAEELLVNASLRLDLPCQGSGQRA